MPTLPLVSAPSAPIDLDIVDARLRTEFERDRQLALKGHDARKKLNGKRDLIATTATAPLGLKRTGLGQRSAWKKSVVTLDDMSDYPSDPFMAMAEPDEDRVGKENSRPSPSVSLEDLIRSSVPTGPPGKNKVARQSVSRASLSRQSSCEALSLESLTINPSSSTPLTPITERSPLMVPCEASDTESDAGSVLDFSISTIDNTELVSPGAEDWTMEETQDGSFLFSNLLKMPNPDAPDAAPCVTSTVLVQSCDW